ncbi:ThiF family adenylyltransferase [Fodinibius sediminis]|uniref:ThiF family protein n=1 Tax=Fodinibius sediminis TaxID=1214077 RepID=A0A521ECN8_9BACT|nr:ThiF family adenylyltransferase [Fodinibius sediminis]SMO81572.1 ThiF family protein [Fodinibius sediminis]
MNNPRITLLGSQEEDLKDWLTGHPHGHERGAIILFRRFSRPIKDLPKSDRFVAVDIIKMTEEWIIESSKTHMKINMRQFPEIYYRCENENLELGFVHNHPDGFVDFSSRDDTNEKNILYGLSGCNGEGSYLVSLVLVDRQWIGRVRHGQQPSQAKKVRHIGILSDKVDLQGIKTPNQTSKNLKRQEAAFGKPFNAKLQSLRVAVVGLGGTGSPVATLLARTGIGELILIDGDELDKTNMNRVRGYVNKDISSNKAEALSSFIEDLGLEVTVKAIPEYLGETGKAIDALSSADIIFGCTDSVQSRDYLNQAMYYYGQVYIDSGMSGNVEDDSNGIPRLRTQKGRVSCILPESGACLRCQNVVNNQKLYREQKLKENPELRELDSETLAKDYYIFGSDVQSPGIGPFTSATANNAVATLMNLISQFRKLPSDLRQDNIWIDFVHMDIHSNKPRIDSECIYCQEGTILLKDEGKNRLETPQLGKVPSNV